MTSSLVVAVFFSVLLLLSPAATETIELRSGLLLASIEIDDDGHGHSALRRYRLSSTDASSIHLDGGPVGLHAGGSWYFAPNQTRKGENDDTELQLVGWERTHGEHVRWGTWEGFVLLWAVESVRKTRGVVLDDGKAAVLFETEIRAFKNPPGTNNDGLVTFVQRFQQTLSNGTSTVSRRVNTRFTGVREVCTAFPVWRVPSGSEKPTLNALNYAGYDMTQMQMMSWNAAEVSSSFLGSTIAGSPLALYDVEGRTVVLSPLSHPVVSAQLLSSAVNTHYSAALWLSMGLNGKTRRIDASLEVEFVVVYSRAGVTEAFLAWGDTLLARSGKTRPSLDENFSQSRLGYMTDNGAFYYYHHKLLRSYEHTMEEVQKYLFDEHIPIAYFELDSWWYWRNATTTDPKFDGQGGVLQWWPRPDVFPSGNMAFLVDGPTASNMPAVSLWLHNRYVDPYNWYNSTEYKFLVEAGNEFCVLPVDERWYARLMLDALEVFGCGGKGGCDVLMEQDWMGEQVLALNITMETVETVELWMGAMDRAAAKTGVSLMWDSPVASQIIASAAYLSVVQGSSMMDYHPGNSQWKNGLTNLLLWSTGLIPWKDTFFSSSLHQLGCPYNSCHEPNPELQALVAILTAGPVSPGDGIGYASRTNILRTCTLTGRLLKPDHPLLPLSASFAWTFDHVSSPNFELPQIASTFSDIDGYEVHYLFAANLSEARVVTLEDLGGRSMIDYYVIDWIQQTWVCGSEVNVPAMKIPPWTHKTDCTYPPCGQLIDFRYYVLCPIWQGARWTLLGELDKFVAVSQARFRDLVSKGDRFQVRVRLDAREPVTVSLLDSHFPESRIDVGCQNVVEEAQELLLACESDGKCDCHHIKHTQEKRALDC